MMHTYSFSRKLAHHYIITIGHSSLDSAIPDKFLEIPSYMLAFGEKDYSKDFALLAFGRSILLELLFFL